MRRREGTNSARKIATPKPRGAAMSTAMRVVHRVPRINVHAVNVGWVLGLRMLNTVVMVSAVCPVGDTVSVTVVPFVLSSVIVVLPSPARIVLLMVLSTCLGYSLTEILRLESFPEVNNSAFSSLAQLPKMHRSTFLTSLLVGSTK